MGRTIIVGDVHGCSAELDALLDRVAFSMGDALVFVGDLVARGPDSRGVLAIARQTGAIVVRGNHEQRLLEYRDGTDRSPLSRTHAELVKTLGDDDWHLMELSVLSLELPQHRAWVVHAGVVPRVPLAAQKPGALLRMRCLDRAGRAVERSGPMLWGLAYDGPEHVVFGHNAMVEPQVHRFATGIDTACVYGGRLTAMVLQKKQAIPRGRDVKPLLVSVPARAAYVSSVRSQVA